MHKAENAAKDTGMEPETKTRMQRDKGTERKADMDTDAKEMEGQRKPDTQTGRRAGRQAGRRTDRQTETYLEAP